MSMRTLSRVMVPVLLACAVSCVSEQAGGPVADQRRANTHFSVVVDDIRELVRTKTVLTDDSIETKITSITLAVYAEDGSLVEKRYVTSGFDDIRYMLGTDETFRVYAVANMGDMRASFPSALPDSYALEDFTYSIPGYTSASDGINARGIPMAGQLVYTTDEGSAGEGQIVMTRLLSKLQVHLACRWPGTLHTVKIYNLNRTLKPFGISAAASEMDILDEQEIHIPEADAKEGDFLFYIPENRQGDIPAITAPADKSRDNDAVTGKDLKTYMEAVVTGIPGDGADGTVTYRSYLGSNNSSDFNIGRNRRYVWNVEYLPGNLQNNDWKHGNALSWKEFEYSMSCPSYVYLGQKGNSVLYVHYNRYESGVFVENRSDDTGIPKITYSVSPGDGSVLGGTSRSGEYFYFTGLGSGTGTVLATCVDPFHPDGVVLSRNVSVLEFSREIFLRTPYGDYYDGETVPIPFGATWENIKVGMKKTLSGGVQTICPVVTGADNLWSAQVYYPTYGSNQYRRVSYYSSTDSGKPVQFSHTFNDGQVSSYTPNQFWILCSYRDYQNNSHQISARIYADISDVDTELITVSSNKTEAYWADGPVSLTASSTAIHNGQSGKQTDITAAGDYQWTVTGSASGMNPQLTLSGGTRVLSVSKAGTVTVTVSRKSDGKVSGSRTITFNDKITYRLNVMPKTVNVKAGDSFRTDKVFTVNQDRYVNGVYVSSEPFTGSLNCSVKSGYSSYLGVSSLSSSVYSISAKKEGTGILRVYTRSSAMESGYAEKEITVNIGQADHYTVTLTPASVNVRENESSPALAFEVRNNGAPVAGVSASDLTWHTRNSAVATVSGGVVTGRTAGSTKVYATYGGATSNEVGVTVAAADVTTYQYKVVTSVNPAAIKAGQTSTASATRFKKTYVNGVATTDWVADGNVTSSGFAEAGSLGKVSISGSTVTALATGSALIKSLCTADEYENATLTISEADYAVSIAPAGTDLILGKKPAQAYTASATKNGKADTGGSFEWSLSPAGKASLSASGGTSVTVTATVAGNTTLTVNYKVGGAVKASASVDFTVFANSLELALGKSGIYVNENVSATVTYRTSGASNASSDVTGSARVKAYTSASGSALSSIVTIGSNGSVTGKAEGECWLEAAYSTGGYSYTSNRVKVTVHHNPLQLSWSSAGAATYVAQRGLLEVGGLDDNSASVSYVITTGSDKVRLTQSGKNTYVGLVGAGSYTIKATASNGQEGTFSGSVSAPELVPDATSIYANPDGSVAHSGTDGLSGNTLSASYKAGLKTLTTTRDAIAVGGYINKDLYEELLAPSFSLSSGGCLVMGNEGVYAARLSSPAYPSEAGTALGTVVISPKVSSTGVASVSVTVRSVNPFANWGSAASLADVEDWGMLYDYFNYTGSVTAGTYNAGKVLASEGTFGTTAFVNEEEYSALASHCVSGSLSAASSTSLRYEFSQQKLAGMDAHVAGNAELRAYVRNRHSSERFFRTIASFRLFVHGAVGARLRYDTERSDVYAYAVLVGDGSTSPYTTPFAAFDGTLASHVFSIPMSSSITAGTYGSYSVDRIRATQGYSCPDDHVFRITKSDGSIGNNEYNAIKAAIAPRLRFPSEYEYGSLNPYCKLISKSSGEVVFVIKDGASAPMRTYEGLTNCGYYVLHILSDVQTKYPYSGYNTGWE